MAKHTISASALIRATPSKAYNIIADYKDGHPRILPKPPFGDKITVEAGGFGTGTRVSYDFIVMGKAQTYHATITEPDPGKVLVETVDENGAVTTFTFEPRENGQHTYITISTTLYVREGFLGKIEGWMISSLFKPVYAKELELLNRVVTQ